MNDETRLLCVEIFRKSTGLDNRKRGKAMSDDDILSAPIDSFDIDSLETMEFIMAVEERFDIELNEEAVNRCSTLGRACGTGRSRTACLIFRRNARAIEAGHLTPQELYRDSSLWRDVLRPPAIRHASASEALSERGYCPV